MLNAHHGVFGLVMGIDISTIKHKGVTCLLLALKNPIDIFTNKHEDTKEEKIEALRSNNIFRYRMKTIKSGEMLECEIYPLWRINRGQKRRLKEKVSREAQKNLNDRNTRKKITRLLNGNFTKEDIWITLGYEDEELPTDEKEAKKNINNYIRRMQRMSKKLGYPKLQYVYVTEISSTGRIHHHLVMNFKNRDIAEQKWTKGQYPQARRLKPNDFGLNGLACYISKGKKAGKRYGYSLNLYKSWEHATIADKKITKRKAEKIAIQPAIAGEVFEKFYKNYSYKDIEIKYSDFVGGVYLYVTMKKIQRE